MATQDELKRQAAQKAVEYVNENEYLGIGTGSTVYFFIEALAQSKGGGGALLNEKIVASAAEKFICIADESKYTSRLGHVSLPVEVTPNARSLVARRLLKLGGEPELRLGFTSDHGNQILDVANLNFDEPIKMEDAINKIPGVVENGLFTHHPADLLVLGCSDGVKVLTARV